MNKSIKVCVCVCVCVTVLEPTVIKDIHQIMTVVPGSIASWDPECDQGNSGNSNQTRRWCFTARLLLFPGALWFTYKLCVGFYWDTEHQSWRIVTFLSLALSVLIVVLLCPDAHCHSFVSLRVHIKSLIKDIIKIIITGCCCHKGVVDGWGLLCADWNAIKYFHVV